MTWIQVLAIIGSVVTTIVGGIMYIHSDMRQQSARIDKVYEIIVDLLKSRNTP